MFPRMLSLHVAITLVGPRNKPHLKGCVVSETTDVYKLQHGLQWITRV